jgi:predicted aspartyl protease
MRALVQNKVMLLLVDSGSSHTFVSSSFLAKLGIQAKPTSPRQVNVANGEVLVTDHYVPKMEWGFKDNHSTLT